MQRGTSGRPMVRSSMLAARPAADSLLATYELGNLPPAACAPCGSPVYATAFRRRAIDVAYLTDSSARRKSAFTQLFAQVLPLSHAIVFNI